MGKGVLVDTDALIDYVRGRGELPEAKVYFLSEITLYEFTRGTKNPERAKKLLEETFSIVWADDAITLRTAALWRRLKSKGEIVDDRDLIIAATAIGEGSPSGPTTGDASSDF